MILGGLLKTRTRIAIVAALIVLAAGAAAFWVSLHVVPSDYRPRMPAGADRRSAAVDFNSAVMDVMGAASLVGSRGPDGARGPEAMTLTFPQERINRWLGSLDAEIVEALAEAGLIQPAVAIDDGRLTLYALWRPRSMVVSLVLRPIFDEGGRCRIEIVSVSLGAIKIPRSWLDQRKGELLQRLQDRLTTLRAQGRRRVGPLPAGDAESALRLLLDAARGRRAELTFPPRYGLAAVDGLTLDDGKITISIRSRL